MDYLLKINNIPLGIFPFEEAKFLVSRNKDIVAYPLVFLSELKEEYELDCIFFGSSIWDWEDIAEEYYYEHTVLGIHVDNEEELIFDYFDPD